MKRYVIALIVLLSPVLFAQTASDPQVQQLTNALLAEREKTDALALSAAQKTQQIAQMNQALSQTIIPACVLAVETANPLKTLDATTLKVKDKPKPEAK